MGGHGGSSGYAKPNVGIGTKRDEVSAMTKKQVVEYLSGYGIKLGKGTSNVPIDTLKETAIGITEMIEEFPIMRGAITEIRSVKGGAYSAMASYTGDLKSTTLTLGPVFKNKAQTANLVLGLDDVSFHTLAGTMAHETAHALDTVLTAKQFGNGYDGFKSKKNNVVAESVVTSAYKSLLKKGIKKPLMQLRKEVSDYAATDLGETLAECAADYYVNGSKAKPLSKEVWTQLKNIAK